MSIMVKILAPPKRLLAVLGMVVFQLAAIWCLPIALAQEDRAIPGARPAIPPATTLYPLPEVAGVVQWEKLIKVDVHFDGENLVAIFTDEVEALVGTTVKMVGFLIPLAPGNRHMLLSMLSPSCPFCQPGGQGSLVELLADEPIDYTLEAVVLSGTFEIVGRDWTDLFYRLSDIEVLDTIDVGPTS